MDHQQFNIEVEWIVVTDMQTIQRSLQDEKTMCGVINKIEV